MRRKLLTTLALAGLLAVGLGTAILPASAEPRHITVTLVTGQQINLTVDAPPCTPVSSIPLPQLPAPVASVTGDSGSCPPPPSVTPPPAGTQPPATQPTTPTPTPTTPAPGGDQQGQPQSTTTQPDKTTDDDRQGSVCGRG